MGVNGETHNFLLHIIPDIFIIDIKFSKIMKNRMIIMDTVDAIRGRRAINFFDPQRTVPDELLFEVLNVANLAPSSFNLQPWHVVVVRDTEKKKILRKCASNQPKVEEAPVVLIIVADLDAIEINLEMVLDDRLRKGYMTDEKQKEPIRNAVKYLYEEPKSRKRLIFAVKNSALFAMNFMIAARSFGLETHPMDGFDEECVKREFSIPEDKIVPMLIAVGYMKPGVELLDRPMRRPLEYFTHYEIWGSKK